jgi:hypothetical protein
MVIASASAWISSPEPACLFFKGGSKKIYFHFHLPVSLLFSLLILIDKNICGHLQELAGVYSSESLKFL